MTYLLPFVVVGAPAWYSAPGKTTSPPASQFTASSKAAKNVPPPQYSFDRSRAA